MMREDNLLAVQPKMFVTTTDSNHALEIYLNLAHRCASMPRVGVSTTTIVNSRLSPQPATRSASIEVIRSHQFVTRNAMSRLGRPMLRALPTEEQKRFRA